MLKIRNIFLIPGEVVHPSLALFSPSRGFSTFVTTIYTFSIDFHPKVLQLKEQTEFSSPHNNLLAIDCQEVDGVVMATNIPAKDWISLGSLAMGKIGRNFNEKGIEKQIQTVLGHYNNEKLHCEWNI